MNVKNETSVEDSLEWNEYIMNHRLIRCDVFMDLAPDDIHKYYIKYVVKTPSGHAFFLTYSTCFFTVYVFGGLPADCTFGAVNDFILSVV